MGLSILSPETSSEKDHVLLNVLLGIAQKAYLNKDFFRAEKIIKSLLELRPESDTLYFAMAYSKLEQEEWEEAGQILVEKVLRLNPQNERAKSVLIYTFMRLNNADKVREWMELFDTETSDLQAKEMFESIKETILEDAMTEIEADEKESEQNSTQEKDVVWGVPIN